MDLATLVQMAVPAPAKKLSIVDMPVEQARNAILLKNVARTKVADAPESIKLFLGREVLSLEAVVPNAVSFTVPADKAEETRTFLTGLINEGKFDSAITDAQAEMKRKAAVKAAAQAEDAAKKPTETPVQENVGKVELAGEGKETVQQEVVQEPVVETVTETETQKFEPVEETKSEPAGIDGLDLSSLQLP